MYSVVCSVICILTPEGLNAQLCDLNIYRMDGEKAKKITKTKLICGEHALLTVKTQPIDMQFLLI